jgi:hypothetical protein
MKKRVLIFMSVMAVAALASWNVSQSGSKVVLSDMALTGTEALAQEEATITCTYPNSYGGQCHEAYGCNGNPWCGCRFSGYQSDFCYYG